MLIERLNKYIKEVDIVDTINNVGRMTTDELVEYLLISDEKERLRILSNLDSNKRKEVETLMEGGIL
jgi:Mg/Co/Ni transporter MgtE